MKKERKTSLPALPALALAAAVTVAGVVGGAPAPSCLFHGKGVVEKAWADAKQVIGASGRSKWTEAAHFVIFSLRSVPAQAFSGDFSGDFSNNFASNFSGDFSSDFPFSGDASCSCAL